MIYFAAISFETATYRLMTMLILTSPLTMNNNLTTLTTMIAPTQRVLLIKTHVIGFDQSSVQILNREQRSFPYQTRHFGL